VDWLRFSTPCRSCMGNSLYLEVGLEVLRRLKVDWLRLSTPYKSSIAEQFLPGGWSGGAEEAGGGLAKVLHPLQILHRRE
jgi:hypothetical protein